MSVIVEYKSLQKGRYNINLGLKKPSIVPSLTIWAYQNASSASTLLLGKDTIKNNSITDEAKSLIEILYFRIDFFNIYKLRFEDINH